MKDSGGLITIVMIAVGGYLLYQLYQQVITAQAQNLPVPAGAAPIPGSSFLVQNATPLVPAQDGAAAGGASYAGGM